MTGKMQVLLHGSSKSLPVTHNIGGYSQISQLTKLILRVFSYIVRSLFGKIHQGQRIFLTTVCYKIEKRKKK